MNIECSENKNFKIKIEHANSFFKRLKGLMFRESLESLHGLLLSPCSDIHTCFMKFPIDVVYLNKDYEVILIETVDPWKFGKIIKHAKHVLELNKNEAKDLNIGDHLKLVDTNDSIE